MITKEQIEKLCGDYSYNPYVLAVLTRDYKPSKLNYVLLKGAVVEIGIFKHTKGDLYIDSELVDNHFPYDAAELLESI